MLIFKANKIKKYNKFIILEIIKFILFMLSFVVPMMILACWGISNLMKMDFYIFAILVCVGILIISLGLFCIHYINQPKEIVINNSENDILCYTKEFNCHRKISQVKSVIDYGGEYYIKFNFTRNVPVCICQKDLITQGTIEEFEELFKDKIIRKY